MSEPPWFICLIQVLAVACLAHFYDYSDEMLLGLGRAYSLDARFAATFRKYHEDLPEFLTKAIEFYIGQRKAKKK